MAHTPANLWKLRLATLALWTLAGASATYWGLRLTALPHERTGTAAATLPPEPPTIDANAIARLLGAPQNTTAASPTTAPPAPTNRLVLQGILAGTQSSSGAALIAINGQPAKPYRIGAEITPGLVLQSLERKQARLGATVQGEAVLVLDIVRK